MGFLSLPLDGSRSTFQLPVEIWELHFSFLSHLVISSSYFVFAWLSSHLCKQQEVVSNRCEELVLLWTAQQLLNVLWDNWCEECQLKSKRAVSGAHQSNPAFAVWTTGSFVHLPRYTSVSLFCHLLSHLCPVPPTSAATQDLCVYLGMHWDKKKMHVVNNIWAKKKQYISKIIKLPLCNEC